MRFGTLVMSVCATTAPKARDLLLGNGDRVLHPHRLWPVPTWPVGGVHAAEHPEIGEEVQVSSDGAVDVAIHPSIPDQSVTNLGFSTACPMSRNGSKI